MAIAGALGARQAAAIPDPQGRSLGEANTTASASRPDTVLIGAGIVDGSFLRPYSVEYELTRIDADGSESPTGRWTDDVTIVERGDRQVLRRELSRYDADGNKDLWRVHLVDHASLAPVLTHHQQGPDLRQITHIDFEGESVTISVLQDPETPVVHLELELEQAPFDLALYATLLVAFPLREGYEAVFPVIGPTATLKWETLTVSRRETLSTPDGDVDAWVVETDSRPWTAWLMKEAPYIAKIEQRRPDGSRWISTRVP
jgi:hypothetical protein